MYTPLYNAVPVYTGDWHDDSMKDAYSKIAKVKGSHYPDRCEAKAGPGRQVSIPCTITSGHSWPIRVEMYEEGL